jgi:hypothetical protein
LPARRSFPTVPNIHELSQFLQIYTSGIELYNLCLQRGLPIDEAISRNLKKAMEAEKVLRRFVATQEMARALDRLDSISCYAESWADFLSAHRAPFFPPGVPTLHS